MSLALSDTQIDYIMLASRPLKPKERAGFMAALFEELLMRREAIGEGELARTLRELQRRYFQPPSDEEVGLTTRFEMRLIAPAITYPRLTRAR